jgi:hypothetical protein
MPEHGRMELFMKNNNITITDKTGRFIKSGDFTQPEVRMIAKAGYRVFDQNTEITEKLINLYEPKSTASDTSLNN